MAEILIIPIAITLTTTAINNKRSKSQKNRSPKLKTSRINHATLEIQKPTDNPDLIMNRIDRPLLSRTWFVLLCVLLCMAYILPEILRPGELTGLSVYKIVMGVGFFFFILVQSSISHAVDAICKMKSVDLEFLAAVCEKNSNVADL